MPLASNRLKLPIDFWKTGEFQFSTRSLNCHAAGSVFYIQCIFTGYATYLMHGEKLTGSRLRIRLLENYCIISNIIDSRN